jgi:DNA-binding transcriptional LysR family regulator
MQLSDRVGRRIKLHDLHVLMAVAQAGSMTKAATALKTTQPAISKSIAALEHTFGVRLLDRNPQGVQPTEYGRALLNSGVKVFDDLRQGVRQIESLADPAAGEVRIGCHHFLGASFVPAVIERLSRRYPRMVFHIVASQTDVLQRELSERKVDLVVGWKLGALTDEQMVFEHLYDDPHVVVAGARNPWVRRRSVKLADLMKETWTLAPPESVYGAIAREAFRASGFDYPRATVFSLPTEARIALLATGRFLSILSTSVLRFPTRRSDIKILPVELPLAGISIGILALKGRTITPASQLFIETARDVVKTLKS